MRYLPAISLFSVLLAASCGSDPEVCPYVSCPSGFECVDGECVEMGDPCDALECHENAACVVSGLSAECVCDTGYTGDGIACVDVDECAEGLAECDPDTEVCVNTPGSYDCECKEGFEVVGDACEDVDECALGLDDCGANASCTNTFGGFECDCDPGYSGDGAVCHPSWSQLQAGFFHFCAIRSDGSLWCWGFNNTRGQLGLGDEDARSVPTRVGDQNDWAVISTDWESTCGIRQDGSLWCWGSNSNGQLGRVSDNVSIPTRVGSANDWSAVAVGREFSCGIRRPADLYCWGLAWGPLTRIGSDQNWRTVDAGASLACGQTVSDALYCWEPGETTPTPWFNTTDRWDGFAVGGDNVCATRNGALYCSGNNSEGQAGTGSADSTVAPMQQVDPDGGPWAKPGGLNGASSCAIRADGSAWCWGWNFYGALGNGEIEGQERSPVLVAGGHTDWEVLEPMYPVHGFIFDMLSCGLRDGGRLFCWGGNQLAMIDGASPHASEFVPVQGPSLVSSSSGNTHSCGIGDGGELYCWGYEQALAIGPFRIPGLYAEAPWDSVEVGGSNLVCGMRGTGLWCYGPNDSGQLGQGDTESRDEILQVEPAVLWRSVAVGMRHACGIRADGSLFCWGSNSHSQLGSPVGDPTSSPLPVRVGSFSDWQQVGSGDLHNCGIREGRLYCWGSNMHGQLGRGVTGGSQHDLAEVNGGHTDWISVWAGRGYTCGTRSGGTIWCWGHGYQGKLGLGDDNNRDVPTRVGVESGWALVSAGSDSSTCAIRSDGSLWTWGDNSFGQLGVGSESDVLPRSMTPLQVGTESDWVGCSAGSNFICAVKTDRSAWCAGINTVGQIGDGRAFFHEPVPVAPDL